MIRLQVLGPVELRDNDGREVRSVLAQPKRLALLACLVVGPPGFRRRDSVLALLWPELDETRARAALNQAIRFLRRELGDRVILSRGVDEVGIDSSELWCDAAVFRDLMDRAEFADALRLYRGDLLEAFYAEQGAGFQEWLERERDLLRAAAARGARAMAGVLEKERNYTPAVAAARRAVELAASDERVMRELLQLLGRLGDHAGALEAYASFERRLAEDFDAKPAVETVALIEKIRARAGPTTPADEQKPSPLPFTLVPVPEPTPPMTARSLGNGVQRPAEVPDQRESIGAKVRSALQVVFDRKWWILGGALLGAAATLATFGR